ncbi:MAG: nitrilase-related carbon-nitrogen hydrolase [Planctomycetota bacterium]
MNPLRVASVQLESTPMDEDANFDTVEQFVRRAADRGVELFIFPECCLTGKSCVLNCDGRPA